MEKLKKVIDLKFLLKISTLPSHGSRWLLADDNVWNGSLLSALRSKRTDDVEVDVATAIVRE